MRIEQLTLDQIHLVYAGKPLDTSVEGQKKRLVDLGMGDKTTVLLVGRLKGG